MFNLAGGTLNLDGNYGTPAGVVEMLMQSHEGDVHLLPALADEWKEGSIRGIVARGGFEIDIEWKDGRLVKAEILSRHGGEFNIRYGDETKTYNTSKGQRVMFVPKPAAL
jgi:alpha-L-fucosidase 2